MDNAGVRLWRVQKNQGTGLCIGLDPHLDKTIQDVYKDFGLKALGDCKDSGWSFELFQFFAATVRSARSLLGLSAEANDADLVLTGVTRYYRQLVEAYWRNGIRVFKPQSAFYERFAPFGQLIMMFVGDKIWQLSQRDGSEAFVTDDAKRGDIDTTQEAYYRVYLSGREQEVFEGMNGVFAFDSITVNGYMGEDVLTPGLPFFKDGRGATVVTYTSNGSGTTFQNLLVEPNLEAQLTDKQKPFELAPDVHQELAETVGHCPTLYEAVLFVTQRFCDKHGLDIGGVSPIFSVMGATMKMNASFRMIRPNGIALNPGFGAQEKDLLKAFSNIMPLLVTQGPLAGHIGILTASRASNYAWMKKYGGNDDPDTIVASCGRFVDEFREKEQVAYKAAGVNYPF